MNKGRLIKLALSMILSIALLLIVGINLDLTNNAKAMGSNLLLNKTYTFGTSPNGTIKDTNPVTKLTDGVYNYSVTQSVQWDFSSLSPGATVSVTFDMGNANWLTQIESYWTREDNASSGPG